MGAGTGVARRWSRRLLGDPDRVRRVGVGLAAASAAATVIGLLLFLASGGRFTDSWMLQNVLLALALAIAFSLMVRQQPHNGAVWTLGWAMVVVAFSYALARGVIEHRLARLVDVLGIAGDVPVTFGELPTSLYWLITWQEHAWLYGWVPLMTLGLLLFPNGQLPSRRWRLAVMAAVAAMVVMTVPFWIVWQPQSRAEVAVFAYGEYPYPTLLVTADAVGALLFSGAFLAAIASLVVRYRRASGDTRRQIRWVALGGGFLGLTHLLWVVAIVDFDLAERLVYGQRATPYEVLSRFSRLAANGGDEANLQRMADVLAAGTGAAPATVWLRVGDHIRPAASSGASGTRSAASVPLHDGALPELPASLVVPVRHDDELLGAVSLTKPRNEPPTPQDEARRKLERDLHDGAQQQLVALKVKLGMAHTIAVKEDAGDPVTGLIERLSAVADASVVSLRTLARGIYPPLLEAEGLERALGSQVQLSPVSVDLRTDGVRRYDREVEATVYSCVLEAVRNAVTYADATSLQVVIEEHGGLLGFQVVDDGRGFDPTVMVRGLGLTTMGDRIDALGGNLAIEAAVGTGARIVGTIPVASQAHADRPDELVTVAQG